MIRQVRSQAVRLAALLTALFVALPGAATDVQDSTNKPGERVPLHTVVPVYPEAARRDRIEGEVQVCFEITRAGLTRRIAVRNSTHRVFEKPARKAVKQSTYTALPRDAEVPAIKTCRTFRFSLEPVVTEDAD